MANIFNRTPNNLISRLFNYRSIKMSAQLRAEKAVEELKEKNPFYGKYASKIAALQKTAPNELLSRVDKIEKDDGKASKSKERYVRIFNLKKNQPNFYIRDKAVDCFL